MSDGAHRTAHSARAVCRWARLHPSELTCGAVALLLVLLVLGPALGPGLTLAYDLGWSPDPTFTPFVTGAGMVAPRAVPSDAVGVLLGIVVGAGLAEKLVLVTVLLLAALGPAALLRDRRPPAGTLSLVPATVLGVWNPFVLERLAIGQWTVLLGYALLGWAVRSALRWREGRATCWPTLGWLAAAGLGGANTVVLVTLTVVVLLLAPRWRPASAVLALVMGAAVSAVWALPALVAGTHGDSSGGRAFAPTADTPLGVFVSVLGGGGTWNAASHPAARDMVVPAVLATVVAGGCLVTAVASRRRAGLGPLLWAAAVGLLLALGPVLPGLGGVWDALVSAVPGGGLLRDSQKLVAPWVLLLAVGGGILVERLTSPDGVEGDRHERRVVLAAALVLLPIAVLPTLAWGVGGRLEPVTVPADYRAAVRTLARAEPGDVGVLPWRQYRRYEWNGSRVSLSLAPRVVDRHVVQDDSLPLASGRIAGEEPRSATVTAAIAAGTAPVQALREQGVRYVFLERRSGVAEVDRPDGVRTLYSGASAQVWDLGAGSSPTRTSPATRWGWLVTALAWLVATAGVPVARVRRRGHQWGDSLLPSGT